MRIRHGTPADADRVLEIWRDAVDATHSFLSAQHRIEIDAMLAEWLPTAQEWLVEDADGRAVGFMVMDGRLIDALFVDPAVHGCGYGTALLNHALKLAPNAIVDANEQADNALPFYEARGFVRAGRSETDSVGRPYPQVHLVYAGNTKPSERQRFSGKDQRGGACDDENRAHHFGEPV